MPKTNPKCDSQKQHVSISQFAYSVIQNDAITFEGKTNDSGTINRIILSYRNHHFPIVDYPIDRRTYLKKDLKIRLNAEPHKYLYAGDSWKHIDNITRQSEFIRLLVENYAHSTFYQREQIYFRSELQDITNYIKNNQVIRITTAQKQTYIVKPYRISNIYESSYNYLIGLSKENKNSPYRPASFRLSRIYDINEEHDTFEEFNPDEIKHLDEEIRIKGVEFVLGDIETFEVKLSPYGKHLYDTIFHLRPMHEKQQPKVDSEGNISLIFKCTRVQLINYFFRFGADAVVAYPPEVQEEIKEKYEAALIAYENNS